VEKIGAKVQAKTNVFREIIPSFITKAAKLEMKKTIVCNRI